MLFLNDNCFTYTFQVSVEGNIGCGKSTLLDYFKTSKVVEVKLESKSLYNVNDVIECLNN